ncbi:hypothetical protein ACP275_14G018500 [Erythranthe tilingii]
MTRELQSNSMDIDSPDVSKASPNGMQENGLNLYPVSATDSGEGLPYAPENFPNPGDKWGWKVGRRLAASGHFLDRYVYIPTSLCESGNRRGFASKLAFEQYIRGKFPDTDIDAFFASFSWRIPSTACKNGQLLFQDRKETPTSLGKAAQDPGGKLHCKAGNKFCSSLAGVEDSVSQVMPCDICCSEPGFCRDCCCILCCRTFDKASSSSSDTYSYIRCEAKIEGFICGHSCHIECALRAYMAGTVGGSIGLDAEYYCRRCDSRTDLVPHFKKLLEDSGSIVLGEEIEKVLRLGVCALRGSEKTSVTELLSRIELAISKLKNGTCVEDIWKKEDVSAGSAAGLSPNTEKDEPQDSITGPPQKISSNFDHRIESLKLEDEIDHVLDALRKSQEMEYRLAEERLSSQKNCILNLYQQLDKERSELSSCTSRKYKDSMLDNVLNRVDQIKREVSKLKDMEEVAKGFGKVPKQILKEQFGVDF